MRGGALLLVMCFSGAASAECLKVANVPVTVEIAKTETEHAKGLMFRETLPANTGMWFMFGQPHRSSFWMKNTFIPLDIIFVSRDLHVLSIFENAKPFDLRPIASPVPYWYVLEVPAGFAKKHQLRIGDRITNPTPKC